MPVILQPLPYGRGRYSGVRQEELKAYGERLQTQVEKLEQEIYAETGCEFNINSPKQLGGGFI